MTPTILLWYLHITFFLGAIAVVAGLAVLAYQLLWMAVKYTLGWPLIGVALSEYAKNHNGKWEHGPRWFRWLMNRKAP